MRIAARHAWLGCALVVLGCGGPTERPDGGIGDRDAAAIDASASDARVPVQDAELDAAIDAGSDGGVVAACDPGSAADYAAYREAARTARCAAAERCGAGTAPWFSFGTSCHPSSSEAGELDEAVARGTVCFDDAAAAACLDALATLPCDELLHATLELCMRATRPRLAPGEACVDDRECIAGRCVTGASCPGTCEALPAEGEACADLLDCAPGLYCTSGTCRAPQPEGAPCQAVVQCQAGLLCVDGSCAPGLPEGERCAPFECDETSYCAVAGNVCRARGGEGASCSEPEECLEGLVCSSRICRVARGPGDPCSLASECPQAFGCDGTCVPLPRVGEACDATLGCWEGDCIDGTCTRRSAGETCSSDADCEGYCDIDVVFGNECVDRRPAGSSCSFARTCERGLECRAGECRAPCPAP